MYLLALLFIYSSSVFAKPVIIDSFQQGDLSTWQQKSFVGYTDYKITDLGLRAISNASASSLYKNITVDLEKTPYLNWSWRIDKKLDISDEKIKQGDDLAARVYIITKSAWGFWQRKSLIYVWASHAKKFDSWGSPYAIGGNVIEIALRSKNDQLSRWYIEKRDVLADLQQHFGNEIHSIDAIAIMTDTDNTNSSALTYYKDIYFSEH